MKENQITFYIQFFQRKFYQKFNEKYCIIFKKYIIFALIWSVNMHSSINIPYL